MTLGAAIVDAILLENLRKINSRNGECQGTLISQHPTVLTTVQKRESL